MGLRRVAHGELCSDADIEPSIGYPVEDIPGSTLGFSRRHVMEQRWSGDEERAVLVQALQFERWDVTRCATEERHEPAWSEQREPGVESIPADAVVDGVETLVAKGVLDGVRKIDVAIPDHVIGTGGGSHRRLLLGTHRCEYLGAAVFCDLDQQATNTPGPGVHQTAVTRLETECVVRQIVRSEALKRHRCRGAEWNRNRHGERTGSIDQRLFGVTAVGLDGDDTISRREPSTSSAAALTTPAISRSGVKGRGRS